MGCDGGRPVSDRTAALREGGGKSGECRRGAGAGANGFSPPGSSGRTARTYGTDVRPPRPGRGADPGDSYTARLLSDRALVRDKLREEAGEVCAAPDRANLVWELADLLYHASVLMEAEGITLDEVEAELRGRHR